MGTSRFTKATKTRGVLGQDTQSGEASPNISTLLVARDSPGHVRDMSRGDLGESLAQLDPYPLCSVVVKFAESQEFLFHPREFALYTLPARASRRQRYLFTSAPNSEPLRPRSCRTHDTVTDNALTSAFLVCLSSLLCSALAAVPHCQPSC